MSDYLEIPLLRTFVAIADNGGFSLAAAALHMSQSTVSQHVRQLERALETPLVQKDGRKKRFTPAGEKLLGEARRLLSAHDQAFGRLKEASERPVITIGSTETAADEVLPEILSTVKAAFPDRRVQFHIERSTRLVEALRRGDIDVAVLLGFNETPGALVGKLPMRWYASSSVPMSVEDQVSLVAYTEPCGMRQRALQALHHVGTSVEIVAESGNLEGVIAGAKAGLGVAVLPSAGRSPRSLKQVIGFPELGEIGVYLAARQGVEDDVAATVYEALEGFFGTRDAA